MLHRQAYNPTEDWRLATRFQQSLFNNTLPFLFINKYLQIIESKIEVQLN